jgi:HPt (histidine-containing phosphotransfer) domain-containing protein
MNDDADRCLDSAALARLRQLGGAKFVREMINLFLDYAPKRITEALAAQRAGDLLGIAKAVHPLRSGGGHVGAYHVRDLAERIEELIREQIAGPIPPLLSELETAFAQARVELEKERDTLSP